MIKKEKIENYSGFSPNLLESFPRLKKDNWKVLDFAVGGDAPKNFIAIYEYSKDSGIRKSNSDTWPRYIAKVGHKWYPLESINEYLFNQIGEVIGINMAYSRLVIIENQLRFLSRYFLKRNESLEHGAQIFAGYISDKEWIETIEQQGLARKFFTFQFAETAIETMFPRDAKQILGEFVKMLVFDALTGNNDRHFYNWGVIKNIESRNSVIFAPVYDSARGLFWNDSESKLLKWKEDYKLLGERIKRYAENSKPKIGWEGLEDLNHFELIDRIFSRDSRYKRACLQLINQDNLEKILTLLKVHFPYYSSWRLELIEKCLIYRFDRLMDIVK